MKENCIFCQIISGKIPSHKIYEDERFLAFLDIQPVSLGHTLVIPKHHAEDVLHASPEDRAGLLEIMSKIAPPILAGVRATGFNIGINTGKDAGQVVFHTHLHIIPRFPQDGLKSWGTSVHTKPDLGAIAQKIREKIPPA